MAKHKYQILTIFLYGLMPFLVSWIVITPKNCRLFHENHRFFEVFEIIMISESLILSFFKELKLIIL